MSRRETQAKAYCGKIMTALASDDSLTAARPLCEVIELPEQQGRSAIHHDLGESIAERLLRFFLNSANGLLLRRWAGLLVYELCRTSESIVKAMVQSATTASPLSALGRIVQSQDDKEDLILVAAMIMSELAVRKVDQRLFWSTQPESDVFAHGRSPDWMVSVQSLLDGFSESQASQANVFYPRAVHAGSDLFLDEQKGRLLMLIEDRLTVVIVPPAATHTLYIDIPFGNVRTASISSELELRLGLSSSSHSWTYVVNAEPHCGKEVHLELSTESEALHVLEEVQRRLKLEQESRQQHLRSARSSSAALVFDGLPGSDGAKHLPQISSQGASGDKLLSKNAPDATETKLHDDDSVPGKINHDATPTIEDDDRIYSLPKDSPESPSQMGSSRKDKRKAPDEASQSARQPATRPHKHVPKGRSQNVRKRQSAAKRKSEDPEVREGDDEYRPRVQQKTGRETTGRVTRASAALRLRIDDSLSEQDEGTRASKQSSNMLPKPDIVLSSARQTIAEIKRDSNATATENELQRRSGSRQQRRHRPGSMDHGKSNLQLKGNGSTMATSEERDIREYEDRADLSDADSRVQCERDSNQDPERAKTKPLDKTVSTKESTSNQKETSFMGATNSRSNTVMISSDESDISSSEKNESPKLRNAKSRASSLQYEKTEPVDRGARPKGLKGYSQNNKSPHTPGENGAKTVLRGHVSTGERKINPERSSTRATVRNYHLRSRRNSSARSIVDFKSPLHATCDSEKFPESPNDKFGLLIEEEEILSTTMLPVSSLLPVKRSGGPASPQKDKDATLSDRHETGTELGLPTRPPEKRLKRHDDTSEPGGPLEHHDSPFVPDEHCPYPMSDRLTSPGSELEPSPLARHSNKNSRLSSVDPAMRVITPAQNQQQGGSLVDTSKLQGGRLFERQISSSPTAISTKVDTPSTLHEVQNMHSSQVGKMRQKQILNLTAPASKPAGIDDQITLSVLQDKEKSVPAKELGNCHATSAIPLPTVGKARSPISHVGKNGIHLWKSQRESLSRFSKRGMKSSVAQDYQKIDQGDRARSQPKQLVSSNSKKVPEPPGADSKAITIHVPQRLLETSRSLQTPAQPLLDPFREPASTPRQRRGETEFMRKLRKQVEDKAKASQAEEDGGRTEEGHIDDDEADHTLVDMVKGDFGMDSMEGNSSTTAVSSSDVEPCGHDENMEWESSLKPYQRDVFDVLVRISRRFVRHLIDSETAIADIILEYEADGTHLIELMEEAHQDEYRVQRSCLLEERAHISGALSNINHQIVQRDKRVQGAALGNNWKREASATKKHVHHLEDWLKHMVEQ